MNTREGSDPGTRRTRTTALAVALVAVALVGVTLSCAPTPTQPPGPTPARWLFAPTPFLVDEFSTDGPIDPAVWFASDYLRDAAYLTSRQKNVRVEGGHLTIEAHAEDLGGARFTSAMIETHEAFLHGRFVARMKFPLGAGTWPAFWLCCRDGWPDGGEIDVVEHYAGDGSAFDTATGLAESNVHSSRDPLTGSTSRGRLTRTRVDATQWHTYAVDWAPDEIRFYVDDQLTAIHRQSDYASANGGWPFDSHPEAVLFDLFVGGPAGAVNSAAMPQQLQVDWVHGYHLLGPA